MKKQLKKINLVLLVAFSLVNDIKAQNNDYNIIFYISAYAEEVWGGENLWEKRGVPEGWKNSFDRSINLDEEVNNLLNDKSLAQRLTSIVNFNLIRQNLIPRIKNEIINMVDNSSSSINANIVIMGHGVTGGLISRYIGSNIKDLGLEEIRNPYNNSIIIKTDVTVITVGTPHQGFPLVQAAFSSSNGNRNIEPVLEEFRSNLFEGFTTETSWIIDAAANLAGWFGTYMSNLASLFENQVSSYSSWVDIRGLLGWGDDLKALESEYESGRKIVTEELPVILDRSIHNASIILDYKTTLEDFSGYNLGNLFAPNRGSIIKTINAGSNPSNYRSIIGTEKKHVPVRMASEVIGGNLSESGLIRDYEKLREFTQIQENAWDTEVTLADIAGLGILNKKPRRRTRERRAKWKTAKTTIDNIDTYWGKIIGSYAYETRTGYTYELRPCVDDGRPGIFLDVEALMNITSIDDDCYEYVRTPYNYTVRVPSKNDGFFAPQFGVWNSGDSIDDRIHNFHYDDGDNKGFNNLELVRFKRTYTEGNQIAGQLSRPMRESKEWLDNEILGNN